MAKHLSLALALVVALLVAPAVLPGNGNGVASAHSCTSGTWLSCAADFATEHPYVYTQLEEQVAEPCANQSPGLQLASCVYHELSTLAELLGYLANASNEEFNEDCGWMQTEIWQGVPACVALFDEMNHDGAEASLIFSLCGYQAGYIQSQTYMIVEQVAQYL